MPNHVHALIEQKSHHRLGDIVSSWKRFSARAANRELGHFDATIAYIENNPVKAGLARTAVEWPWGHARLLQQS